MTAALRHVDQATLCRLQEMAAESKSEIAAADAKASALLGWAGTVFALITGFLASSGTLTRSWAVTTLTVAGVLALGGCVVALIWAVRPRLHGPGRTRRPADRSFLHLADLDPAAVLALAEHDVQPQLDPGPAASRAQHLAAIARRKHRLVRAATTLLLVAMPALGAGAITGAVQR